MSVGVGIVGCGTISTQYLRNLTAFPELEVRACGDLDVERAKTVAEKWAVPIAGDLTAVLDDPSVDLVVNLTVPSAHVEVAMAALRAGKHVYGEKPLTLDRASGERLLADAAERGLRVGCAPDTFLGAGLQNAARLVAAGEIGTPLSATATFQNPGPDRWHPNPDFLFARGAGPLLDIGPYYLTALVQVFGPIARVAGVGVRARDERTIGAGPRAGQHFPVEVATHTTALVQFADGAVATLLTSFDSPREQGRIEIAGSEATLRLPDPNQFDGPSRLWRTGAKKWKKRVEHGPSNGRGLGVLEMARAIEAGRPHRASGELALHVLDAMLSIEESTLRQEFVELRTSCERPEPLPADWAVD